MLHYLVKINQSMPIIDMPLACEDNQIEGHILIPPADIVDLVDIA